MKKMLESGVISLLINFLWGPVSAFEVEREYQIKAAMLYKLTRFIYPCYLEMQVSASPSDYATTLTHLKVEPLFSSYVALLRSRLVTLKPAVPRSTGINGHIKFEVNTTNLDNSEIKRNSMLLNLSQRAIKP